MTAPRLATAPACWSWPTPNQHHDGTITALVDWQQGRCAICGNTPHPTRPLVADHDHATGLVRGLLCRVCNTTEGTKSDPGDAFAQYRERHPAAILGLSLPYRMGMIPRPAKTVGTWRADWIGEPYTNTLGETPALFDAHGRDQGALFDDQATAAPEEDPAEQPLADRLDEIGRIRAAAAAAAVETPALVAAAYNDGMRQAEIARRLQCNESYVRKVLREHRARQ